MKRALTCIIITIMWLPFSACGLSDGETLYREPQPSPTFTLDVPAATQSPPVQLEPSLQADTVDVEMAEDVSPVPEAFTLVVIHPSQGGLQAVLAAHAQQATDRGRRPFVEFSAEWCPPCQAIEASLGDPLMVEALGGIYLIRVDIDEWGDQITRAGFHVPGIPLFFELDELGKKTGRAISGAAWGEDIPQNMAPPLAEFFQTNQ